MVGGFILVVFLFEVCEYLCFLVDFVLWVFVGFTGNCALAEGGYQLVA